MRPTEFSIGAGSSQSKILMLERKASESLCADGVMKVEKAVATGLVSILLAESTSNPKMVFE